MLPLSITLPRDLEATHFQPPSWVSEILLEHQDLARLGSLGTEALQNAMARFSVKGLPCVLVWDILGDDPIIERGQGILDQLNLQQLAAIRVADPGIAEFLKQHYPQIPLQLSLETGNHNLPGIQAWVRYFQPQKIVLSNELPLELAGQIRKSISVPAEISVLGRILLFYTPRHLLEPIDPWTQNAQSRSRFVTSVEDGKHFPIEENQHGTFMFYEKDLFLLSYLNQIKETGLDAGRIDLKFYPHEPLLQAIDTFLTQPNSSPDPVKACLAPRLTRGFFKSNRTDKQFKRLKNARLVQAEDREYLGTVVETRKKQYIAQMLEHSIRVGDRLVYQIPEGDLLTHEVMWIRDKEGQSHLQTTRSGLWLVNHRGSISPGSLVYRSADIQPEVPTPDTP